MITATLVLCALAAAPGDDPFADAVLDYAAGSNPATGYDVAATALASPERFTGEGIFPGVVSCFNPPYGLNEIVSVGVGGHLAVAFDTPVADDPGNPFGIDLLIFSNAFLIDESYPDGIANGLFADEGGVIEVSADGVSWVEIEAAIGSVVFPTLGYTDAGPYDAVPGTILTDFTRPVDPSLEVGDFNGLNIAEIGALYGGSGGGAGVDLGSVGLDEICCVRITNPGDPAVNPSIEIDAFADVAPAGSPADFDGDGTVGVLDLLLLLGAWGPCPAPCPFDLDGDGIAGVAELLILLGDWTT